MLLLSYCLKRCSENGHFIPSPSPLPPLPFLKACVLPLLCRSHICMEMTLGTCGLRFPVEDSGLAACHELKTTRPHSILRITVGVNMFCMQFPDFSSGLLTLTVFPPQAQHNKAPGLFFSPAQSKLKFNEHK